MYHADLMGGLAARLAGIRAIGWGIRHSNLDPALNKPMTLRVVKICALLSRWVPRRILVCSEAARRVHVLAGYAADKMVVVPNGFDLSRFQPNAVARADLRAECGLANDTPLVGLAARFDPQKNIGGFLEAAALLVRQLPQVHFLLAGTGLDSGNAALVSDITRLGLADCIHLLGARDDMPRVMAAIDVLASPSHGEAFPNVLGEAMACGVPCAVTDAGDSAMIVGDTGRVVPVADMSALADSMFALLSMPRSDRIALGERARQRVQDHFEIGHVVRQYEAFYRSLRQADTSCAV